MNGSFHFRDGEGGTRSIELQILPHGEVEVAETFVIRLSHLFGDMDIDPKAGSVTLQVRYCYTADSLIVRMKSNFICYFANRTDPKTGVL